MTESWKQTLTPLDTSIRSAMEIMGKSRQHVVLAVDESGKLLGTVTDGDIRRSILKSMSLDEPIQKIMNRNPATATPDMSQEDKMSLMRTKDIQLLPVVDDDFCVIGMTRIEDLIQPETLEKNNWVVLMAGGLGSRLHPLTQDTPKPMLSVGGRPILETIIRTISEQGLNKIYLSVHYKAEMVREHFGDGSAFGLQIRYLEEDSKLGTAGALSLIQEKHDLPLIVMNADLLTKVNFDSLLSYHAKHKAAATVCVREFSLQIPYGVIALDNNKIEKIDEKPSHNFIGSAGIYVLNPDALSSLQKNKRLDMPDFIHQIINDGGEVVGYPVHEYWIDIGKIEDFRQAATDFSSMFS